MKHGARFTRSIPIVAAMLLSLAALFFTATPATAQGDVTANVASSPSSGPVGTTITVSGSGWTMPDGTQVSFGYMDVESYCLIVPDSQEGILSGGFFSGWFHWPKGTLLSTYTVCANVGGTTATANTFSVLSASAPQISITPTTLTAGQQATITGANFFPAGTAVQLFWETVKGSIDFGITPVTSNNNGSISRTFTVPATALPGGSYMIEAVVGGSQPPALSASAPFTYTTPVLNPTPTPSHTSTPTLSPTAAATKGTTPTVSSTTPAATQNPTTSQTPVINTTSNDSSNAGGSTPPNQPGSVLLIAGVIGSLVLLITLLAIVLLIRHKKARSRKMIRRATPAVGLNTNGVSPWQNGLSASPHLGKGMPGQFSPAWVAPPVNGGQAVSTNNGAPHGGNIAVPPPSKPLPFTPYTQLLQQSVGGSVDTGKPVLAPYDPVLEAMKRQAQIGLFAVPGQHGDERLPSRR
jgi:hypothetical protein